MLEPDARAGPAVDPDAFLALKRHFDVEGHVVLDESVPGLLRVMLRHASGRCAAAETHAVEVFVTRPCAPRTDAPVLCLPTAVRMCACAARR